ncbi:hypothetical protein V6N13_079522 [Hibiscus sabdariffa]
MPATVASMVAANGGWNWNQLCQWLPADALAATAAIKPPRPDAGADVPGWRAAVWCVNLFMTSPNYVSSFDYI